MSFHIKPSSRLEAILLDHAGPRPVVSKEDKATLEAFVEWSSRYITPLDNAVESVLASRTDDVETWNREHLRTGQVNFMPLGEVPCQVLGHACRWTNAQCNTILGSYLGEIVLEDECSLPIQNSTDALKASIEALAAMPDFQMREIFFEQGGKKIPAKIVS